MGLIQKVMTAVPVMAVAMLNAACSMDTVSSKDVKADAIHQVYSLSYSEESNSTNMSAQFRVGGWSGTTVSLDDPSSLKINGRVPGKSTVLGTSYDLDQGGFIPSATFEYKSEDGKTLVNSIAIDRVQLLKADSTVSAQRLYAIDLSAPNLQSNESVRVTITQESRQSDGSTKWASADGSYDRARQKAFFQPSELNKLSNGPAKLSISRGKQSGLAQATREGGMISASYALRPVFVTIVDAAGAPGMQPLAKQ
jgi:hypothetical protein